MFMISFIYRSVSSLKVVFGTCRVLHSSNINQLSLEFADIAGVLGHSFNLFLIVVSSSVLYASTQIDQACSSVFIFSR